MKFTREQAQAAGYNTSGYDEYWTNLEAYEAEGEWEIVPPGVLPEPDALFLSGGHKSVCPRPSSEFNRKVERNDALVIQKVDPEPWLKLGYVRKHCESYFDKIKGKKIPPGREIVPAGKGNKIQQDDQYLDMMHPNLIRDIPSYFIGNEILGSTVVIFRKKLPAVVGVDLSGVDQKAADSGKQAVKSEIAELTAAGANAPRTKPRSSAPDCLICQKEGLV